MRAPLVGVLSPPARGLVLFPLASSSSSGVSVSLVAQQRRSEPSGGWRRGPFRLRGRVQERLDEKALIKILLQPAQIAEQRSGGGV